MRLEIISSDIIEVFLNKYYFIDIDILKQDELLSIIKDLIIKIDKRYNLNLSGFYKVKVFLCSKLGVFLKIIKIDDNEFTNEADFRIVIYDDCDVFFETDNYDIISNIKDKLYYNGNFYVDLKKLDLENKYNFYDMGRFIYGDELKEIIKKCIKIK